MIAQANSRSYVILHGPELREGEGENLAFAFCHCPPLSSPPLLNPLIPGGNLFRYSVDPGSPPRIE
jgi:hypothetical protein